MQENYELLTETLNPLEDKLQLHFYDLLTMDDLVEIEDVHEESGRKCACEKMVTLLLEGWKGDSLEKFLQVLNNCDYKECARQILGKYVLFLSLSSPCASHPLPSYCHCTKSVAHSSILHYICTTQNPVKLKCLQMELKHRGMEIPEDPNLVIFFAPHQRVGRLSM